MNHESLFMRGSLCDKQDGKCKVRLSRLQLIASRELLDGAVAALEVVRKNADRF
uniref:Uncharacterized protein n=1 Tax=Ralstonia syzygii R24 TaxID=907261 RepID=G3A7G4_9RALS|nr:hypothetical protein RALSY_40659 [Ralstonia syzygii R24]